METNKFKRYLNDNFLKLDSYGIRFQELVALYFDLRPLVRIGVSYSQFKILKEACLQLGFKLLITEPWPYGPNKIHPLLLISKSQRKLKEYYSLEREYEQYKTLGEYLGYPVCCQIEYVNNIKYKNNLPNKTLLNTRGELNFLLNYLYSFDSRKFDYVKFNRISTLYNFSNIYLIPHIPCSFNCKSSIKYATKLLNIIKLYLPQYYKKIVFFLSKPILFLNDFIFFPLIGEIDNDTIVYHNFIKIHRWLSIKTLKLLQSGNLIRKENNIFNIYSGNYLLGKLPLTSKLFNFK